MKIRTKPNAAKWWHQDVVTTDDTGAEARYCGDPHCTGKCGLPALVIPADDRRPALKARGDAGAICNVFAVMGKWDGPRIDLPEDDRAAWLKRIWM